MKNVVAARGVVDGCRMAEGPVIPLVDVCGEIRNGADFGPCPLCHASEVEVWHRDARREYGCCAVCRLVFVPSRYFLSQEAERACYDQHQNDPSDSAYRRFLSRLFDPLVARLRPGARGLDFGSGPGPTLSVMLNEAGFPMAIYDPFYAPHEEVWQDCYDFVTTTEVVEHLHRPMVDLQRVWRVLKPGGWLGIMTKRVLDAERFATWHYKNDPTHVVFYSEATFAWLATQWSAKLIVAASDVVLLQKAAASAADVNSSRNEP
ncbi:MAG: class I SAM-dependent methyltransferase [Planctomycetaceae bacterium]|nr:class I SAM-dependent methyltransferase [Planctomycetaceae bacterium]